jgi:hypothetical protein
MSARRRGLCERWGRHSSIRATATYLRLRSPILSFVATTPEHHRQVLVLSQTRTVRFLLLAAVFVAIGILGIARGNVFGWVTVVFFGLGLLVFAFRLIKPPTLELDPDGFTLHGNFSRERRRSWAECGAFAASRTFVVYSTSLTSKPRLRRVNRALAGGDESIPVGFGDLSATELANLMNRHGQPGQPSSREHLSH